MRIYRNIMRFDRAPRTFLFVKRERALNRWPECSRLHLHSSAGFRVWKKKYPKKPISSGSTISVYGVFFSLLGKTAERIGMYRYNVTSRFRTTVFMKYSFLFFGADFFIQIVLLGSVTNYSRHKAISAYIVGKKYRKLTSVSRISILFFVRIKLDSDNQRFTVSRWI